MTLQQTQSAALWVGQKMQLMVEASEDLKALLHGSLLRVLTNLLLMTPTKSKWGWYVDWEISFFTHDVKHIFVFLGECFCGWTKRGESLLHRWYEEEGIKGGGAGLCKYVCIFFQLCLIHFIYFVIVKETVRWRIFHFPQVVEAGALPVFLRMLQHDDPKEQSSTAHCIWTLSFDKTVRQKIIEHEGLVAALENLSKNENSEVRKNCLGALWMIKGENDPATTTSKAAFILWLKFHFFF